MHDFVIARRRLPPRRLVALLAVLAVVATSCGVVGGRGGGGMEVTAEFTRAVSLFPGSQVRVLGLPAGDVADVEVEGDLVKVTLRINGDVTVPADAQAMIVPFSLIGERYVQLFPAYTGGPKMKDGAVIGADRTSVPVEPDEALESLRDLLDDLNPEATQRLTRNLAADLEGQGQNVNDMLANVGELTRDLGAKSDSLGRIIDHFDEFTATLVTRESQIGTALDQFAAVTAVLADERDSLANIIRNLGAFAADARDLVEEHGAALASDLEVLEHVSKGLQANLDAVGNLLDAAPIVASGLKRAYNSTNNVVMLRDSGAFENATEGPAALPAGSSGQGAPQGAAGQSDEGGPAGDGAAPPAPETPFDPLDELLRELVDTGTGPLQVPARAGNAGRSSGPERLASGVVRMVGRLGGLARSVVGA
ncbi:MAG: MCE family protein [Actinobacteria bacterium]|nr:MCE family protein [Actinomycetota bacterium]